MNMRGYEGLQDLQAMLELLSEGARAANGTYYVHRGDLQWWLFYNDAPPQAWQSNIRLWVEGGRLLGWALLSPEQNAFDVFTVPELCGDPRQHEMLAWAAGHMPESGMVESMWNAEGDAARIDWLEGNGFTLEEDHYLHFTRSLFAPPPEAPLPAGFHIRASRGDEADARLRSAVSHAAFGSRKPFEEYWPRTWRFMQSPVYVPGREFFVIAPDGRAAAFCIVWADELTGVGHFEPVGTHPDFQRRGLGKSLLFEAMRRLKSEGMTVADVCTNHDNAAAIRLYETAGFELSKKLLIYRKVRWKDG